MANGTPGWLFAITVGMQFKYEEINGFAIRFKLLFKMLSRCIYIAT